MAAAVTAAAHGLKVLVVDKAARFGGTTARSGGWLWISGPVFIPVSEEPCRYDDLPVDGLVELWFENAATLEAAFSSPAGQAATRHARMFLAEITAFLVVEHRIV